MEQPTATVETPPEESQKHPEASAFDSHLAKLPPEEFEARVAQMRRAAECHTTLVLAAVSLTRIQHWKDFGGKPYLEGKGADALCPIGIRLSKPEFTVEIRSDEYFVECDIEATWPAFGRNEHATGACSTLDKFFRGKPGDNSAYAQALERCGDDVALAKRVLLADVKKKAHENAKSRAVASVMGLRGVTWEELAEMGLRRDAAGGVREYGKGGSARVKAATTVNSVTLSELIALPTGSKVAIRAEIESGTSFGKYVDVVCVDNGARATVRLFNGGKPDWMVQGASVFFSDIKVGEYRGRLQYTANHAEPGDDPDKSAPPGEPTP